VHYVSPGFFETLGVRPLAGRTFRDGEDRPGHDRVVVLGHDLWTSHFGGDRGVVGRTLVLDGEPWTAVGVMPPGFGVRGGVPDLWAPLSFGPERPADRSSAYLGAIGRLAPGVTLAAARAELEAAAAALAAGLPAADRDRRPSLEPLVEVMVAGQGDTMRLLLAAAALLLAAAAVNAAALGLAQAHARRGEAAVRSALGAGRSRLVRQWLLEGVPPAALGGALGAVLAAGALAALPDLGRRLLYRSVEPRLGVWVLALTAVAALVTWLLAAGLPALAASRPVRRPGAGVRATRDRGERRTLSVLVAGQVAVAAALLAGAGLLLRGLERLTASDLGFERRDLLLLEIEPPPARYPTGAEVTRLLDELVPRLAALPGVSAAAAATDPPGAGWGCGSAPRVMRRRAKGWRSATRRLLPATRRPPACASLPAATCRPPTAGARRGWCC
jgi:putative ABC transport system permease protein